MTKKSRARARGYIKPQEARFFELILQMGSAVAKKQALQSLCGRLRTGYVLAAPMVLKGLIFQCLSDSDSKVRRWAFNALAQFGSANDVTLIMPFLEKSRTEADVFEAGLTAIARILPKENIPTLLSKWDVPMSNSTIMALAQQSSQYSEELAAVGLNLDHSSVDELRSATLIVGLQKAPDNLFSAYHPVTDVIGALNTHHDPIVAQYSFWAAAEHPSLGLSNMRIAPKDYSSLPPNVQGWALRVLTQDKISSRKNYDVIVAASEHSDSIVREGLAIGLRDLYYDSLDATVMDWYFDQDEDLEIKEHLLEHMCVQASHSSGYREQAVLAFRESAPGSARRARLESACVADDISLEFRRIVLQTGDPDLFNMVVRPTMNTTNNQTINAQNIGGVSGSGTGNEGQIQILNLGDAKLRTGSILSTLDEELQNAPESPAATEGKSLVAKAISSPTKLNIENIVKWLKSLKAGGEAVSGILKSADTITSQLHHLLPHLPMHF